MHTWALTASVLLFGLTQGSQIEQEVLTKILDKYDSRIRPSKDASDIVKVNVQIFMLKLGNIDEVKGNADLGINVAMGWNDSRLAWDNKKVKQLTIPSNQIWVPDLCLSVGQGVVRLCFVGNDKFSLSVYPNGEVYYVYPVNQRMGCILDTEKHGLACTFEVKSWTSTSDLLRLKIPSKVIDTSLLGTYLDPSYKLNSATYSLKRIQYPNFSEKWDIIKSIIDLDRKK